MIRHFASTDEIFAATRPANINAGITCLNDGGKPGFVSRMFCPAGGPVVYCNNGRYEQVVDDDSHSITFASTGRGKTRRFIYPTVMSDILAGTSIVVNDMKGEIYETTKHLLALAGYTTYVLDLRDPGNSPHRYNPLTYAWDEWHKDHFDAAFMSLRSFALSLIPPGRDDEPFWEDTARDYFVGLALGMLEVGVERDAFTLESLARMDLEGEELVADPLNSRDHRKTVINDFFDGFPSTSVARQSVSGTINMHPAGRLSVLGIFRQPMALYAGQQGLMDVMCRSDFTARDLARERQALFVISPDETHAIGPVVVGILNQLMSGLITHAQQRYKGKLPHRVDFILDEMGNLPARIPDLEALVSAARSRNIRFHFVLQSAEQLTNVYGKELREVILDNCDTWVFMGSRGLPFLRLISELAGTVRLETGEERPLLSVDKLQHLETRDTETEALVFMASLRPYVAALKDIGCYNPVREAAAGLPAHKWVSHKLFRIKAVSPRYEHYTRRK